MSDSVALECEMILLSPPVVSWYSTAPSCRPFVEYLPPPYFFSPPFPPSPRFYSIPYPTPSLLPSPRAHFFPPRWPFLTFHPFFLFPVSYRVLRFPTRGCPHPFLTPVKFDRRRETVTFVPEEPLLPSCTAFTPSLSFFPLFCPLSLCPFTFWRSSVPLKTPSPSPPLHSPTLFLVTLPCLCPPFTLLCPTSLFFYALASYFPTPQTASRFTKSSNVRSACHLDGDPADSTDANTDNPQHT